MYWVVKSRQHLCKFRGLRTRDVASMRLEFFHFSWSVMTLVGGECHKSGVFMAFPISILPSPFSYFFPGHFLVFRSGSLTARAYRLFALYFHTGGYKNWKLIYDD